MKRIISYSSLFSCTAVACFLVSCTQDSPQIAPDGQTSQVFAADSDRFEFSDDSNLEAVEAELNHREWNLENPELVSVVRPDGSVDQMYQIDGDIQVTRAQLQDLRDNPDPRQYSTNNLVSYSGNSRTIRVTGLQNYGGGFDLAPDTRTGLQWAINNLNNTNSELNFTVNFDNNLGRDIVVYRQPGNSGAGGVAGFPSGGNPFKWVQIYAGMDNFSSNTNRNRNVNEHVCNHEILHCLGFRHTDWFSRQSCGQSGESQNPTGANLIPGTPSGFDASSIMLACFSSSTNGEMNSNDKTGLRFLY